ncbi:hypothetical protein ACFE04_001467 [Oxalis oulophora]
MLSFKSKPALSSLILLLLIIVTLFFFSYSASAKPHHYIKGGGDGFKTWEKTMRRSLAVVDNNSTLILAAHRTHRPDPLDHFNDYNGGFNISNEHYWASVALTAAPFFIIAIVWFIIFGLCMSFICLCYCCCPREPYGYSRACYALSLIFLVLFTVSAIVGCVVLYTGQGKFHSSTSNTLDYVVHTAHNTSETLKNVSLYLDAARGVGVDGITLPEDAIKSINDLDDKINSSANTLSSVTANNKDQIQDGLNGVRMALIVLAAVMLFLTFLGFVFSIFGWECLVYTLVIAGWILVAATFILCGVFLLLHNVVADSCVSMDEWVLNPTAHTALDDIIPCVDNTTAQQTLRESKNVTNQLVSILNQVITEICNLDYQSVPPQLRTAPIYYNQSGPKIPLVCSPFHSDLTDRNCAPGEVHLDSASEVWKNYTCEVSGNLCTTPGRLTPSLYSNFSAVLNVSYGLYHYGPFLVNLVDCTFVRDTFTTISHTYCPGLRRYTEWIYVGLVLVSAAVMFSLIFWVIYARERRHRVYTKQFMGTSYEDQHPPK